MQVKVQYLGMLRELAARETEMVEARNDATLGELYATLQQRIPELGEFRQTIALAVNYEYSGRERVLHEGDEVALIPPVSGGNVDAAAPAQAAAMQTTEHAALLRRPIDRQAIVNSIQKPDDGALVVFDGVVRNQTRGRRTLYLEYTAYEPMALQQMEQLAQQALVDFKIRDVWIVHRLGRLEIGETSVYIALASPHRAAAFEACRWVIDTLKKTVPIWKKEFFEDGAVWADGEPFPPEIPMAGGSTQL
jgi:molybdopterin synthase catalytic subunit